MDTGIQLSIHYNRPILSAAYPLGWYLADPAIRCQRPNPVVFRLVDQRFVANVAIPSG